MKRSWTKSMEDDECNNENKTNWTFAKAQLVHSYYHHPRHKKRK